MAKFLFCPIRPRCPRFAPAARDLPLLPAIRFRRPGCPFRAIRPLALNNFQHPCIPSLYDQECTKDRAKLITPVN